MKETYQRDTKNIWFPNQKEPLYSDEILFKAYWSREKDRLINGFYLADKQVYISGWLYWHTVYWTIESNTEVNGRAFKQRFTPKLRDIDWEMSINKEKAENEGKIIELVGARGFGKSLPSTTKTQLMSGGYKEIGKIVIGDYVIGRDGKPAKVLGVFPQGVRPMYKFTLADGREITSDEEHLWGVYSGNKYKVIKTIDIVNSNYKSKHKRSGYSYKYSLPEIEPIQYTEKELPIDPYILGALIGDGSLKSSTPRISTDDYEILNEFKKRLPEYRFTLDESESNVGRNIRYSIVEISKTIHTGNRLSRAIEGLGLKVSLKDKFIPDIYKYASIQQRLELLQGLMDTDGSINTYGSIELTTINKRLAEDVMSLARSLGIRCQLGQDNRIGREHMMPQGKMSIQTNITYRVFIRTDLPIFKLTRKLNRIVERKRNNTISIVDIVKVEDSDATCIYVDNEDHLFLVEDYIPTHNSVLDASMAGYYYTLYDDLEACISAGNAPDIKVVTEKIECGLVNIHPVLKRQRIVNDWKKEVRAGFKDKAGVQSEDSSNSRIVMRNFKGGNESTACAGLRPKFHVIDEIGKIKNLKNCVMDSIPCWINPSTGKYLGVIILSGTGGEMSLGQESGEMFNDPKSWNILEFDDIWENKGKIGWFMPATKAVDRYKFPQKLSDYLGIQHKDIDHITIMVADEELGKADILEERARVEKSGQESFIKHKAYYPLVPSDAFLVLSSNSFNVENAKHQQVKLKTSGIKAMPVDLIDTGDTIIHKASVKPVVDTFPFKGGHSTDCAIMMFEPPIPNPPYGLYIAGIDPYKQDSAKSSDSLGSVYIFKRMHDITSEMYQDMFVAWYTARPDDMFDFYANTRNLLKYYNAIGFCENEDIGFIQYMKLKNEDHMLADQPNWLKEIHPNTDVKRNKGIHVTQQIRNHLNSTLKGYLDREISEARNDNGTIISRQLGVHKVADPMLLEEIIKYNKDGNFDRIVAASLAVTYASKMDTIINISDNNTDDIKTAYFNIGRNNSSMWNKTNKRSLWQ